MRSLGTQFTIATTLAWRNLWRNHRRTLVMLAAIVVGVWAMILFGALMRGMLDEMVRGGLNSLPGEVQIHNPQYRDDPSIENSMAPPAGELLASLDRAPITAWTARIKVPGMLASERDNRGLMLLGVDPAGEVALGFDPKDIVEGRFLESASDRGIVIGRRMAERLETELGKRVVVMSQDLNNEVADRGVRVVGIFRARLQADEESRAWLGRDAMQELLGAGDAVSEIAVTGNDYKAVDDWWQGLAESAGPELETLPWQQLQPFLDSMFRAQGSVNAVLTVIIFLALSFGLVNTLVMAVFERVREIGLMMALGMKPASVMYQVLLESLYLLALGLIIGNVLAVATLWPMRNGIDISVVGEGLEMAGMGSTLYPVLAWQDMLGSTLIVLILGLLASLLPAWRASRLDPVQALTRN